MPSETETPITLEMLGRVWFTRGLRPRLDDVSIPAEARNLMRQIISAEQLVSDLSQHLLDVCKAGGYVPPKEQESEWL